jgi:hypothetical protein
MPRPPKWNAPTQSVRLPKHAIAACVDLAKALDAPLPVSQDDPQFAAYEDFVRNLKTYLVNLDSAGNSRRYLVRCDQPPTFEEWKFLECLEEKLLRQCQKRKVDLKLVFARLVEQVFQPMKERA